MSEPYYQDDAVTIYHADNIEVLPQIAGQYDTVFTSPPYNLRNIRPDLGTNEHPAPFPLELPTKAITATNAAVVLDPFMGSGTTLRAAKDCNRRAIGIELDERYCEIAAKRMAQEVLDLGGAA